jgi:curved DNA-binding protein CbpA
VATAYEILECPETATFDELRRAWRALSARHHPDRGGSEEAFKTVQRAWALLGDEAARKSYDERLARARQPSFRTPSLAEFEAVLRSTVSPDKATAVMQIAQALRTLL